MCYSAIVKQDLKYLQDHFGALVVYDQIDDYRHAMTQDPKRFPALQNRIYPGHYAPVVSLDRDKNRVVCLMRYGAYPPASVSKPNIYTTFNARRDNLTSPFWSGAFMQQHGCVVLESFFEWVEVKDLLKAGVVSLDEVKNEFQRQAEERKAKILAAGKKYKPTPTEQKDPRFRKIIIQFVPEDQQELMVPVIISSMKLEDGGIDYGFAIVTDDPPSEIRVAGHDRCPVILQESGINEWLGFQGKSANQLNELLLHHQRITFRHQLQKVA